jgi:adenine deaminase
MHLKYRIDVAYGRKPADLLLSNGRVVSVLADQIVKTDVAIADGVIVGFGHYRAKRNIDLKGGFLSSGLMDGHLHIESTLLAPSVFACAVVPHGTTSVIADPHEIANVLGTKGIRYMLRASEGLPLDIYIALPSCVPSTNLETSGARLGAHQLRGFVGHPRVVGIGEVMDYPGVWSGRRSLLAKTQLMPGMRVDGHAPGLTGKKLFAYIAGNISSDHESTKAGEAREKLMAGLHIMLREGTTEKNLRELSKMVTPANSHRCFFCSDDRSPSDLLRSGHMDDILRKAVKYGIAPVTALQMATNNAPYYFRLPARKGAVAVGYEADLVVFDNLKRFDVRMVFKKGQLVAKDGRMIVPCRPTRAPQYKNTVHIGKILPSSLELWTHKKKARVIEVVPGQIVTKQKIASVKKDRGLVVADMKQDILKLAVFERHKATGRVGVGLVHGFGLRRGALASSVAHDSHNIIVVGVSDIDMLCAVDALVHMGGGFVTVAGGKVRQALELPIAGLMTDDTIEDVVSHYEKLQRVAKEFGSHIQDPFLQLSFLALPVIPELKLTDKGLVDAKAFRIVPLFI